MTARTNSLSSITLTRDAKGQVTAVERNVPLAPFLQSRSTSRTFDAPRRSVRRPAALETLQIITKWGTEPQSNGTDVLGESLR